MLKQCQQIICEWLAQFDLELKPSKTKIVHTLNELDDNKPGFDFLGFNIRQYKVGKYKSGKNTRGELLGFKTIIKPSNESVKRHYQKLSETIKRLNAAPQVKLIKELNPIIKHKHCHDEKTRDDLKAIKAYKQEKEWQLLKTLLPVWL